MNIRIDDHAAELCRIEIEGTIGVPEAWQFDEPADRVATYERFRETVARIAAVEAPEVLVTIRSTGGDVNDALLIHDALRQISGRITTRCHGYVASAATIIAQAASEGCRELSSNALYLIHRASCATEGNADELGARIDLLCATDERLAALEAARSGGDAEHYAALMAENNGNGRWLSPEEALAEGLADRIVEVGGAAKLPEPLARGWRRLLAAVGLDKASEKAPGQSLGKSPERVPDRASGQNPDKAPAEPSDRRPADAPASHNILHFGPETLAETSVGRSASAFARALERIEPTRTRSVEDPPVGEPCRTANERAYAEDARSFGRNR